MRLYPLASWGLRLCGWLGFQWWSCICIPFSLFFNKYVVLLRDFWGLSAGMVNVAVVLSPQASLGLDSSLAWMLKCSDCFSVIVDCLC